MKIRRLHIYNIASVEDAVIDFTEGPLADDTRFLICGPTGAGKTTILDSICLALFNTTPRLKDAANEVYNDIIDSFKTSRDDGSVSTDDPRMLMRRGSTKAFVELEFADREGNVLTALWSCSKAHEKTDGKIQDVKHNLVDEDGNMLCRHKSEMTAEIERRIGLNFDQFCRTTMLAQGDFTRFLKARDSEKSEILEKLTGTEIYSQVSISIRKMMARKREILNEKEAEIRGIRLMDDEDLSSVNQRIDAISVEVKAAGDELIHLQEVHKLISERERIEKALKRSHERDSELMKEYILLLSGLEFLDRYIGSQTAALNEMKTGIEAGMEKKGMYDAVPVIRTLSERIEGNRRRIKEAQDSNVRLLERMKALKRESEEADEEHKANVLEEEKCAKAAEDAANALEGIDLSGLIAARTGMEKHLSALNEYLSLAGRTAREREEVGKCADGLPALEAAFIESSETYRRMQEVYELKKSACSDIMKEIRVTLSEGDACPLCGQKIEHLADDGEFVSLLESARAAMEESRRNSKDAEERLNACKALHETYSNALKSDIAALDKLGVELGYDSSVTKESIDAEIEKTLSDRDKSAAEVENALMLQSDLMNLQKKLKDAKEKSEESGKKLILLEKAVGETEIMIRNNEKSISGYGVSCSEDFKNMSSLITVNDWNAEWHDDPAAFICRLEKDAEEYGRLCENHEKTLQNLQLTENARSHILAAKEKINILRPQWNIVAEDAVKVPQLPDRWNTLFADVKSNHDEAVKLAAELDETVAGMKDEDLTDKVLLEKEIMALKGKSDALLSEQGALRQVLETDSRNRSEMQDRLKEKMDAEKIYEQWYRLYELFGSADGKKFRNIAQSYVLRQLLDGANAYLRRLTERYELEGQPGSLTILLKDKEAGGVLRPVTTVSGGESFLISLSLALGLSSLSSKALSMDMIFIDEGFGTLDSTYLDTVMDTLERLHQMGGRKVGIISHVESLKERMSTQIRVERVNATTSRVNVVAI